jgi:hypothetical protein
MKKTLSIIFAVSTGVIVLAGYFFKDQLNSILVIIIDWGILLLAVLGLIGLVYLLKSHVLKLFHREKGAFFSIIVLISFFIIFITGLAASMQNPFFRQLILNVQIPVEASLMGLLAVTLLLSSFRLIRIRGWNLMSIGFLVSVILSLLLNLDYFQSDPGTLGSELIAFWRSLPFVGARGILLGMALGGLVIGLRILFTLDRPYSEE